MSDLRHLRADFPILKREVNGEIGTLINKGLRDQQNVAPIPLLALRFSLRRLGDAIEADAPDHQARPVLRHHLRNIWLRMGVLAEVQKLFSKFG